MKEMINQPQVRGYVQDVIDIMWAIDSFENILHSVISLFPVDPSKNIFIIIFKKCFTKDSVLYVKKRRILLLLLFLRYQSIRTIYLSLGPPSSSPQAAMSSSGEDRIAAMTSALSFVLSDALTSTVSSAFSSAMAVAKEDAKAELTTLLEEWEEAQAGTTERLVSILTQSVVVCFETLI